MIEITPSSAVPPSAVEVLLDRAFGPDRHAKTAYRVRGAAHAIEGLSFAAVHSGLLVGSVQCWPVRFVADDGTETPLVMVGPVAVAPERQRDGIGRQLMERALAAAALDGSDARLMLIGDPEYYERFFGFTADRTAGWRLPGPIERRRLLARGDAVPGGSGELRPI